MGAAFRGVRGSAAIRLVIIMLVCSAEASDGMDDLEPSDGCAFFLRRGERSDLRQRSKPGVRGKLQLSAFYGRIPRLGMGAAEGAVAGYFFWGVYCPGKYGKGFRKNLVDGVINKAIVCVQ